MEKKPEESIACVVFSFIFTILFIIAMLTIGGIHFTPNERAAEVVAIGMLGFFGNPVGIIVTAIIFGGVLFIFKYVFLAADKIKGKDIT